MYTDDHLPIAVRSTNTPAIEPARASAEERARVTPVVVAVVAGLVLASFVAVTGTRAAFSATSGTGANAFAAGTVALAANDAGSVPFNLSDMVPGTTSTKCVNVTYTGSVTSDVKLYGTVGGTGLATYLTTTIEVGTGATAGASFDCTGFASSSTLQSDTLAAFGTANTDYGNGLGGFTGATNPTTKSYRIVVTLQDDNAAQGLTASSTFTWEAQNT
jgi:type II secretory pathway pseudopilin PulG